MTGSERNGGGNPFVAGALAEVKAHGFLPPLLFAGGRPEAHEEAALAVLAPLRYGLSDILFIDLGAALPSEASSALARTIERHPGPVFLRNLDGADQARLDACLDPDVLGPLCRPVFASSRMPVETLAARPPSRMVVVADPDD